MTNMTTEMESRRQRKVPIGRVELEAAIRDGLIDVGTGTALWQRWRVIEGKTDQFTPALVSRELAPLSTISAQIILSLLAIVCIGIGLAFFILNAWGHFGMVGTVIAAAAIAVSTYSYSVRMGVDQVSYPRQLVQIMCLLSLGVLIWGICSLLGLSVIFLSPRSDIFGPIPERHAMSDFLVESFFFAGCIFFNKCGNNKICMPLGIVAALAAVPDVIYAVISALTYAPWVLCWLTVIFCLIFLCLPHLVQKIKFLGMTECDIDSSIKVVFLYLALQTIHYIYTDRVGGIALLLVSGVSFFVAIRSKRTYMTFGSIIGVVAGLGIFAWTVSPGGLLSPILFMIVAGICILACKKWNAIEKFVVSCNAGSLRRWK